MSASLYYRPTSENGVRLPTNSPSFFIETLEKAFCRPLPILLEKSDIQKLEGMVAMCSSGEDEPYDCLIEAIKKFKCIEVHAVY